MLYECRFCTQGFVGHPGDNCPDCGANEDEFPNGYLHSHATDPPDGSVNGGGGRSSV